MPDFTTAQMLLKHKQRGGQTESFCYIFGLPSLLHLLVTDARWTNASISVATKCRAVGRSRYRRPQVLHP